MIVYKYLHPDRIDVLEKCRIRFTQPSFLNDPFETKPDLTAYRELARMSIAASRKPQQREVLDRFGVSDSMIADACMANFDVSVSRHFGILSLSRCCDNILMWSHYADSHRGFVIGFDSDNPFFSPTKGKGAGGLRDVRYSETRGSISPNDLDAFGEQFLDKWNDILFFTKAKDWAYEQEVRILADPESADHRIADSTGFGICLFNFQPSAIREIIAGSQCSEELLTDLIRKWIDCFPEATMFNSRVSGTKFQVELQPVDREKAIQFINVTDSINR